MTPTCRRRPPFLRLRPPTPRPSRRICRPAGRPPGRRRGRGSTARVENANAAARVEPRREGYFNAIQIYPWSEGALYQVDAAPGQITNIALEPGESLTGAGPIVAGDTARWIIGDTESGAASRAACTVLVKPTWPQPAIISSSPPTGGLYMLELRSGEKPYMPAVAWAYPRQPGAQRVPAVPIIPDAAARNYRYGLTGDAPPWRPGLG